jgi:hypothetical protein
MMRLVGWNGMDSIRTGVISGLQETELLAVGRWRNNLMRSAVLILSLMGTVLFAAAFALSFASPLTIERAARETVRIEVERRVGEKMEFLTDSRLTGLAQRALQRADADIRRAEQDIRLEVSQKVANVVAGMLNADCECRKRLIEYARKSETERLSSMTQVRAQLVVFIESAYSNVTRSLMREFRIFTASNAVAFALLGVVTLRRRRAALQLALPAVVLVGAVAVTGALYLFSQDWLHTIVFGQYVGLAYSVYMAAVALLLSDLVFNRARVTTQMVNVILTALGLAATAVPC